jgi:hypothetical protein
MSSTVSRPGKYAHKQRIEEPLWERLVARIAKENDCDACLAGRIMDQALGFLCLVAQDPDAQYSPSPVVDIGWHTIILYTREYAALCELLAGRFIHHAPLDEAGRAYTKNGVSRTVAAMKVRGLAVDEDLWNGTTGDCGGHNCYTCVE